MNYLSKLKGHHSSISWVLQVKQKHIMARCKHYTSYGSGGQKPSFHGALMFLLPGAILLGCQCVFPELSSSWQNTLGSPGGLHWAAGTWVLHRRKDWVHWTPTLPSTELGHPWLAVRHRPPALWCHCRPFPALNPKLPEEPQRASPQHSQQPGGLFLTANRGWSSLACPQQSLACWQECRSTPAFSLQPGQASACSLPPIEGQICIAFAPNPFDTV